jgi:hypothetical protein
MDRLSRLVGKTMLDHEDPAALGLLRILLVSVFTASLLTHVGAVDEYFSNASTIAGPAAREAFHSRWSIFFTFGEPWMVRSIFAVGVIAHLLWLVGLYTPIAAAISWLVWVSMVGRQPLLYALPDQLHTVLLTLLAIMPSGRGLSLDARRRGEKGVPVWCRRMLQLQIAVVYVATGLLKTGDPWRGDGTALYYATVNPYNRHFDFGPALAAVQPWLLRPLTWLVLVWEIGFGGFVLVHWIRELLGRPRRLFDLRLPMLGFGAAMHLGIQAAMYVAWFTPLMLAGYASFVHPHEARALADRVRARLRRRAG